KSRGVFRFSGAGNPLDFELSRLMNGPDYYKSRFNLFKLKVKTGLKLTKLILSASLDIRVPTMYIKGVKGFISIPL
ncbi:hypothetical protein KAU08_03525, partial [bacterium]|nr:hypothetical protein [bacterium]